MMGLYRIPLKEEKSRSWGRETDSAQKRRDDSTSLDQIFWQMDKETKTTTKTKTKTGPEG